LRAPVLVAFLDLAGCKEHRRLGSGEGSGVRTVSGVVVRDPDPTTQHQVVTEVLVDLR